MTRLKYNALDVPALTGDIAAEAGPTAVTFSETLKEYGVTAIPDIVAPDYLPLYRAGEVVYLTPYDATLLTGTISRAQEDSTAVAHLAADMATTPFRHGPTKLERPPFRGAFLYRSAAQSIVSGTLTALGFDSEEFDTDALHDTATNNTRLTIPAALAGYWKLGFTANASGLNDGSTFSARLAVNGSDLRGSTVLNVTGATNSFPGLAATRPALLAAADYVEMKVQHFHGANRDVNGTLWAEFISPA